MAVNNATFKDSELTASKNWFAITPHDTNAISPVARAIRADAAGAVTFRTLGSSADVVMNLAAGEIIYGVVTHVRDTGTDSITIHGCE